MTVGTIFTLFIVPFALHAHRERASRKISGRAGRRGTTEDVDLAPEYALARDGNGNGWKQG